MLRSLFAGISGLRANQTMLDVTGNNIANANTVGFKASTTVFQDTLSQMMSGAASASGDLGGTNPIQVGLGVQVAATTGNFNQGSAQMTGRSTDLMIQGDGMFVVRSGERADLHPGRRLRLRRVRQPGHARAATGSRATRRATGPHRRRRRRQPTCARRQPSPPASS